MAYATITLEMFASGLHVSCDDIGLDEFVPAGDATRLVDILNEVEDVCNPKATFELTDKGREYLKQLIAERETMAKKKRKEKARK